MELSQASVLVTGGASGLGLATTIRLVRRGAQVVIVDLPGSAGAERAAELGPAVRFAPSDVRDPDGVAAAVAAAAERAPLRALVHCAGRGGPARLLDREGRAASLDLFTEVVSVNLAGTFNTLRLAAEQMATNDPVDGERGVCVLTASIAAFEGQIGQMSYTASKAGVAGMTLVAARDLAQRQIRVCAIAPGVMDTPILGILTDEQRLRLGEAVPHPARLGQPDEFGALAEHIIDNTYLNGETIRLDGASRLGPR